MRTDWQTPPGSSGRQKAAQDDADAKARRAKDDAVGRDKAWNDWSTASAKARDATKAAGRPLPDDLRDWIKAVKRAKPGQVSEPDHAGKQGQTGQQETPGAGTGNGGAGTGTGGDTAPPKAVKKAPANAGNIPLKCKGVKGPAEGDADCALSGSKAESSGQDKQKAETNNENGNHDNDRKGQSEK